MRELAAHTKTLAIGEIGLDFYRDRAPKARQIEVFETQLALAAECDLPVVIHNRQAIEAVWPILQSWQEQLAETGSPLAAHPGVLHSFDESFQWAEKAINSNFFIGISGPVTFRKAVGTKGAGTPDPARQVPPGPRLAALLAQVQATERGTQSATGKLSRALSRPTVQARSAAWSRFAHRTQEKPRQDAAVQRASATSDMLSPLP